MTPLKIVRRRARRVVRRVRQARMMVRAFKDPYQPVAAHLIPTRRCNLSCAYCNEFDDVSAPVPACAMVHRTGCWLRWVRAS